ncbi:unnamed protein product [Cuscuta epithymum]|uniref:Uncharacterized protein n=1 Tax=Cuscuta epithymum TaxID=186058 RepID=A0AAV0CYT5_9ASTE|nr:unnamed protein product [Cuscuta epithymum]
MRFRSKDDVEHKINHLFARRLTMPPLTACPNSSTIHCPDVFGSSLVWCMLDMQDFERVKIPPCMHRHLFEHTKSEAILRYSNTAWPVTVRGYTFDHEFTNFLVENDIPFDTFVLLRHIGNFIFDVLLFNTDGYSRNLAEPHNSNIQPNLPGEHFFVYAQSAIPNCSYRKLFRPPSFLYIPTQTAVSACEAFLNTCCDARGKILIMYGEEQDPFYGGEMDLLQEIQFNFHIDPTCSLVFIKSSGSRIKLLALSKCNVEEPPHQSHTYELKSQVSTHTSAQS